MGKMFPNFPKKYHLIVKSQPQNEDARRFLKPSRTFEKEVQMYGQVRNVDLTFMALQVTQSQKWIDNILNAPFQIFIFS